MKYHQPWPWSSSCSVMEDLGGGVLRGCGEPTRSLQPHSFLFQGENLTRKTKPSAPVSKEGLLKRILPHPFKGIRSLEWSSTSWIGLWNKNKCTECSCMNQATELYSPHLLFLLKKNGKRTENIWESAHQRQHGNSG